MGKFIKFLKKKEKKFNIANIKKLIKNKTRVWLANIKGKILRPIKNLFFVDSLTLETYSLELYG